MNTKSERGSGGAGPTVCPHCEADLIGRSIPEKDRHMFGEATHFLRVISIYDQKRDCHSEWECPDCGERFK